MRNHSPNPLHAVYHARYAMPLDQEAFLFLTYDTDQASARGFEAVAVGYSLRYPEDTENLKQQFAVYDSLYAGCRLQVAKGGG